MPSWFDLITLEIDGQEDAAGIKKAGELITQLLDEEQVRFRGLQISNKQCSINC